MTFVFCDNSDRWAIPWPPPRSMERAFEAGMRPFSVIDEPKLVMPTLVWDDDGIHSVEAPRGDAIMRF